MLANNSIVPPRKTPSATPTATTISIPKQTCRPIHNCVRYKAIQLHTATGVSLEAHPVKVKIKVRRFI